MATTGRQRQRPSSPSEPLPRQRRERTDPDQEALHDNGPSHGQWPFLVVRCRLKWRPSLALHSKISYSLCFLFLSWLIPLAQSANRDRGSSGIHGRPPLPIANAYEPSEGWRAKGGGGGGGGCWGGCWEGCCPPFRPYFPVSRSSAPLLAHIWRWPILAGTDTFI